MRRRWPPLEFLPRTLATRSSSKRASPLRDILLCIVAAVLGWALTGLILRTQDVRHHARPNERSMHTRPVPVGGGLSIVLAIAMLWPGWSWPLARNELVLLGGIGLLAAVSWIDDRRPLWPATRFAVQAVVVALSLTELPVEFRLLEQIPLWVERIALGIGWLWFINLYNFMDGIDGLAGSEAVAVAAGYVAIVIVAGHRFPLTPLAVVIAGAALGYLVWNWHPARIFMGDVGSIPLGFMIGWLMLDLARHGFIAAACILPAYFAADATITLLRRLAEGAKPWHAHKTHFYQRAVQAGSTHSNVVVRVCAANLFLIGAAATSVSRPWLGLAVAASTVIGLLVNLSGGALRKATAPAKERQQRRR